MTVPLWAPFVFLAAVCAAWPRPAWVKRVDWPVLAFWVTYLSLYALFVYVLYGVIS